MTIENRFRRLEARVTRSTAHPGVAVIAPSGGSWALNFGLSNGKNGGGRTINSEHDSVEAAETAYNMLLTRYPAGRDAEPILIICDV